MKITVRTFQIANGFVVGYRRQHFYRGRCLSSSIEYVGRDGFWTRAPINATPFGNEQHARSVASELSPTW